MIKLISRISFFLLIISFNSNAATLLTPLIFVGSIGTITDEPKLFVPIERITKYSLEIDAEKSYFKVEKNPSSYTHLGSGMIFDFPDATETSKYSISGKVSILDEHVETGGYLQDQVKMTSIDIESLFNNIDLSSSGDFWNDDYQFEYNFVDKIPSNWICACLTSFTINFFGARNEGKFDGQKLEYTGEGIFKKDENSEVFLLEPSFDATHKISYHIEANVVSSVPVPSAFYLFFSGVAGLIFNRTRRS